MVSPARAATFVYVGNAESNEVYVLQLDRQSGDLAVVEKVPSPARLQHRCLRPLSARGLPVLQRSVELPDRRGQRQAHQAQYPMGKNPNWIEIVDLP